MRAGGARLAAATVGSGCAASRSTGSRAADPAGADRGGCLRPDVRRRRRAGPHPAAPAAGRSTRRSPQVEIGYDLAGPPTVATVAVRLALRPRVRHGGDRVRGAVPGGGAPTATTRGRLADGPTGGVAAGLRGAVVRDVVGHGPVHAGDVQHAHGRPHAVVDADADPAGVGRAGHAWRCGRCRPPGATIRPACASGCWPRCTAGSRSSSPTRSSRPRCSSSASTGSTSVGSSTRRRAIMPRHVAMNLHFLLSGYLFYWVVIGVDPTPRPHPIAGEAGDGLRVLAAACVLRRRVDGHADGAGRGVLPLAPIALAHRFIG